MRIKRVAIKNFRSIKEATLDCEKLTSILGRNGAGKSAFLHGIKTFYDVSAKIEIEDFYNREDGKTIEICVTFTDLRRDEQAEFKSYIRDGELTVTKKIFYNEGKLFQLYYGSVREIKDFTEIRTMSKVKDKQTGLKQIIAEGRFDGLQGSPSTGDALDLLLKEYEEKHPELKELVEKETQFFGVAGRGKIDNHTKFVYIPAVREVTDETSGKKGAIHQILNMIVLRKINSREDIKKFKAKYQEEALKLYSDDNLKELAKLGSSISTTLEKFSPGSKLIMSWEQITVPDIGLPDANVGVVEDGFKGEINRKGHGLQRALILTLMQHLATTEEEKHEEGDVSKDIEVQEDEAGNGGPDLILAIEEPELYLHPTRSRYLCDLFIELIGKNNGVLGSNNQIILTSHSPHFVDMNRFEQIRIINKSIMSDIPVQCSTVKVFSWNDARDKLAKIYDEDIKKITRDSFVARSLPVMNTIVSEGFFADVVVVVEGLSEVGVLWKLQEIIGLKRTEKSIAIVPAGSKNSIDRPVLVFRGFDIPTYFLFDGDIKNKGKKDENGTKIANRRWLRLAGVEEEDFPCTKVETTWAVFENDLESTLKAELGAEFESIRSEVARELSYDKESMVLKNIQACDLFVSKVYNSGKKLEVLEKIVNNVTALATK